jgi:hypothetical protein
MNLLPESACYLNRKFRFLFGSFAFHLSHQIAQMNTTVIGGSNRLISIHSGANDCGPEK